MDMSVWGLSLDYMAKISGKSQRQTQAKKNLVKVTADGEVVFFGTIISARINLTQSPDAPLEITANTAGYYQALPIPDTYVKGETTAQDVVKSICNQVGLKFANYGVNTQIKDVHLKGNAIEQINSIAHDYGFSFELNLETVSIFKYGTARDNIIPSVSPDTGLIGYPVFYDLGIAFRCMFSSSIVIARLIDLKTMLPNASGRYQVCEGTTHYLSSNVEGGFWETYVVGFPISPGVNDV
ncbi:hypothetical protein DTA24_07995 [Klebsiella sp. P1CD1]|nr:hypothetical protein DTA24_07995 [Klebsiella sp. P1CD1]